MPKYLYVGFAQERIIFMDGYNQKYFRQNQEYFEYITHKIEAVTVYRNITNDRIIQILKELCTLENTENLFSELCFLLIESAEKNTFSGNLLKKYIINLFLTDENIFSLYCENNKEIKGSSVYNLALNDIEIMKELSVFKLDLLPIYSDCLSEILNYKPVNKGENEVISYIETLSSAEQITDAFIRYYHSSGCGNISLYKMFKYNPCEGIVGISSPDPITFDDLIGYKSQIEELINNTQAFLSGCPANSVLLVGARGTGKSSCVKALANKFFSSGLRLIEITKEQIVHLPSIFSILKNRGRCFIIFIDDLSFDEHEIQYKYMKSLLEGGSESKPENVLFYATSNRRHLVRENFSDRSGSNDDEIHKNDTFNEKLSLADRFGITITFPKPSADEYIKIVTALAKKNNININDDILKKEAMKWEMNQKGMSGRTAKQFINNLIWKNSQIQ